MSFSWVQQIRLNQLLKLIKTYVALCKELECLIIYIVRMFVGNNQVIYGPSQSDVCQSNKSKCHFDLQLMQLISFYGYAELYSIILWNPDVLVFIIHYTHGVLAHPVFAVYQTKLLFKFSTHCSHPKLTGSSAFRRMSRCFMVAMWLSMRAEIYSQYIYFDRLTMNWYWCYSYHYLCSSTLSSKDRYQHSAFSIVPLAAAWPI